VSAYYPGRTLLGSPRNNARPRRALRITGVAVPAILGVAAVATVASMSGHGAAPAAARLSADSAGRGTAAMKPASPASHQVQAVKAVPASKPAPVKPRSAHPASYTIVSGDTLSTIAQRFYHSPKYWPVLYWANHSRIRYANDLTVGQVLTIPVKPAKIPAAPTTLSAAPAPSTVVTSASSSRASSPTRASVAPTTVSTSGYGSFQACVIARESGGNSQVMNSSGHYGLYQFSASTWAAYGGNPADFGNASVAEQNQVFSNAMAAGGASNWAPYDGC
jgi:LysM repeat protein